MKPQPLLVKSPATFGKLFRFALPLALVFATLDYAALDIVIAIWDKYGEDTMHMLWWDWDSADQKATYYHRPCEKGDITTSYAPDLFAGPNPYDQFLKHGFVVFPNVISSNSASDLREHILKKNLENDPSGKEFNILHMPENRWLSVPNPNERVVQRALQDIQSNALLTKTLERLLGVDPAMIEMDAITSGLGAKSQAWHSDGTVQNLNFARHFSATHVLLMQLQNTSLAMGPTQVCPGTQMCIHDRFIAADDECPKVVNEAGYLPAGSAVLMDTNAMHRGSAYLEGHQHRVMFVLTVAPRPDSRTIQHGLSHSMHWSMYGHTWRDLGTGLSRPLMWLKSLGLYVPRKRNVGWNLIWLGLHRLANWDANGDLSHDEYHKYTHRMDGYWPDYWRSIAVESRDWVGWLIVALTGLVLLFFRTRGLVGILLFLCVVVVGQKQVLTHVGQSQLVRDLQSDRDLSSFPKNIPPLYTGPITLPTRQDLLIESRLASDNLHMYNDQLEYHPGNVAWRELMDFAGEELWEAMREAFDGRMLYQDLATGDWMVLSKEDERRVIRSGKDRHWHNLLRRVDNQCVYSIYRDSALCRLASMNLASICWLADVDISGKPCVGLRRATKPDIATKHTWMARRSILGHLPESSQTSTDAHHRRIVPRGLVPAFATGDLVLLRNAGDLWEGVVESVSRRGMYEVKLVDEDIYNAPLHDLLPFQPFEPGMIVFTDEGYEVVRSVHEKTCVLTSSGTVPCGELNHALAHLKVGSQVMAFYYDPLEVETSGWYAATVVETYPNRLFYKVGWVDGSTTILAVDFLVEYGQWMRGEEVAWGSRVGIITGEANYGKIGIQMFVDLRVGDLDEVEKAEVDLGELKRWFGKRIHTRAAEIVDDTNYDLDASAEHLHHDVVVADFS